MKRVIVILLGLAMLVPVTAGSQVTVFVTWAFLVAATLRTHGIRNMLWLPLGQ
jgi:hypothetical protein